MEIKIGDKSYMAHIDQGQNVAVPVTVSSVGKSYAKVTYLTRNKKGQEEKREKKILLNRLYTTMEAAQEAASKIKRGTGKTKTLPFKNIEDVIKMAQVFTERGQYHWRFAFMMSFLTARRIGDILELKWSDIYRPDLTKKKRLEIEEDKTNKVTDIPITELMWQEIGFYRKQSGISVKDNYSSRMISERYPAYLKAFHSASDAAGIDYPVSPHSTRRFFGKFSIDLHPYDPTNVDTLQMIFNHSDRETTLDYIGITPAKIDGYFNDISETAERVINGEDIDLSKSPVISLKLSDLRDIISQAYQSGCENSDKNVDIMLKDINNLITKAENIGLRY